MKTVKDAKTLKRIITIFSIVLSVSFSFSCFPTEEDGYFDKKTYTCNYDEGENPSDFDWYLIKRNTSKNYMYYSSALGYVEGTQSRNAISEDAEELSNFKANPNYKWNDTTKITKLNKELTEAIQNSRNNARAAETSEDSTITQIADYKGQIENFYLSDANNKVNYPDATCKYVGTYCTVWFIDNTNLVSASDLDFDTLGQKFDSIYELETTYLGSNKYESHISEFIDPQDKITILVADLEYDAAETAKSISGTYGYFRNADLITDDYLAKLAKKYSAYKNIKSNERQMIYIDSFFFSLDGTKEYTVNGKTQTPDCVNAVYSTLVHEFNHLLNYCKKTVEKDLSFDTWYTEMLAMLAEDMFSDYLNLNKDDIPAYRLPVYFDYGTRYGFTYWFDDSNVYYSYGNAYAYGAYLARNYGGLELVSEIATNGNTNEKSITQALKKTGANITFDETLAEFPLILINYDKTDADVITINKQAGKKIDILYFPAIAIYPYIYDATTKKTQDTPPIWKSSLIENSVLNLYPNGFTIHGIGSGITKFSYYEPYSSILSGVDGFVVKVSKDGSFTYEKIY